MNEYQTMTELGKLFDESSHTIGKWLVDIGLRTPEKKPSKKAFDGGFVKQLPSRQEGTYFYGWHRLKTVFSLEAAGHVQIGHQPPGKLVGPFDARRSGLNGYEIVGGDGTIAVWVIGERNANKIVKLMNLACQAGRFASI